MSETIEQRAHAYLRAYADSDVPLKNLLVMFAEAMAVERLASNEGDLEEIKRLRDQVEGLKAERVELRRRHEVELQTARTALVEARKDSCSVIGDVLWKGTEPWVRRPWIYPQPPRSEPAIPRYSPNCEGKMFRSEEGGYCAWQRVEPMLTELYMLRAAQPLLWKPITSAPHDRFILVWNGVRAYKAIWRENWPVQLGEWTSCFCYEHLNSGLVPLPGLCDKFLWSELPCTL